MQDAVLGSMTNPNLPQIPQDPPVATGKPDPVWVWGVPFSPVTFGETVATIDRLMAKKTPSYIITANLHYVMVSENDSRLQKHNNAAALVLADGMPIVWASRWRSRRLPERVTGSDLLPMLCERAADTGHRVYFLGAAPGVGDEAAKKLTERFPRLNVVGVSAPPFRELSAEEHDALITTVRNAKPDLLFVAFGQPKGEYWVHQNYERLGVPVVMQVGASLDFAAGKVRRAPRWMQRFGLEWFYRFATDPLRLGGRYWANFRFAVKMLFRDLINVRDNRR